MRSGVLATKHMPESHTGLYIAQRVNQIREEFGIAKENVAGIQERLEVLCSQVPQDKIVQDKTDDNNDDANLPKKVKRESEAHSEAAMIEYNKSECNITITRNRITFTH